MMKEYDVAVEILKVISQFFPIGLTTNKVTKNILPPKYTSQKQEKAIYSEAVLTPNLMSLL